MTEHTTVLPEPPQPAPRRRWGLIAVIASVVVVVLVAAGGFAAWRFLSGGGPRPAEVLPASTFGLVTLDLDPSGGQKVEAIKTLRKFPSFRDQTGLKPTSDPLRKIFDEAQKSGTCTDLDYDRDVKSWVGQRFGFGGVMVDDKPVPVATVQVSDPDNAKVGFDRLAKCGDFNADGDFGWTITDDFIVVSDSTEHARTIAAEGKKTPLAEDEDYQRWTDEAGGAGIVNAYIAREAVDILSEELGSGGAGDELLGSPADKDEIADALAAYKDFKGAAAVLHFADGGIELSFAGSAGKASQGKETVGDHVAAMPGDTALLLAVAVPPNAFDALSKSESDAGSDLLGGMLGIDFPDDLETLLGTSFSLSLGGDAPEDLDSIQGPGDIDVGALVHGDEDAIDDVIAKLEKSSGGTLEDLQITKASKDGKVVVASNKDYADELLGQGTLSDDEGFKDAVPHSEDAQGIAYVDFDGDWGKAVIDMIRKDSSEDSTELARNLDVLDAFGASAWTEDGVSHGLVRLSLN